MIMLIMICVVPDTALTTKTATATVIINVEIPRQMVRRASARTGDRGKAAATAAAATVLVRN